MTISCERTKQLDIFCHVNGFTSDFLSFIDVELIRFFHGALQLTMTSQHNDLPLRHGTNVTPSHWNSTRAGVAKALKKWRVTWQLVTLTADAAVMLYIT